MHSTGDRYAVQTGLHPSLRDCLHRDCVRLADAPFERAEADLSAPTSHLAGNIQRHLSRRCSR